jgi:hypothetical protein
MRCVKDASLCLDQIVGNHQRPGGCDGGVRDSGIDGGPRPGDGGALNGGGCTGEAGNCAGGDGLGVGGSGGVTAGMVPVQSSGPEGVRT